MSGRPEHQAPPEIYYDDKEAEKYASSSRMVEIQAVMTARALELLNLNSEPRLLLDIGCGSGLSGDILTDEGHIWVGIDISPSMLKVALERETEGDLFLSDMGQGLPFRPGSFDGAISISALQWLCNADKSTHIPKKRLNIFFQSLYNCLCRGGKAVLQFYPEDSAQVQMITESAMKAGFTGGIVVDYPNSTRAKKYFLCLFAGQSTEELPLALGVEGEENPNTVTVIGRKRQEKGKKSDRPSVKSKEWIIQKKERQRRQGKEVKADTKYTGRKRLGAF